MKPKSSALARALSTVLVLGLSFAGLSHQASANEGTPPSPFMTTAAVAVPIPNGGFEQDLVGGAIPEWLLGQGAWDAFERDTSMFTEGAASIRLTDLEGAARHSIVSARVPADAETQYIVSADLYKRLGGIVMYARYYNASNQQIDVIGQNFFNTAADEWTTITLDVTTPVDTAFIAIELYVGTTALDVNIDNVLLEKQVEDPTVGTVPNGGFEQDFVAGAIPEWVLGQGGWDAFEHDTSMFTQGQASIRLTDLEGAARHSIFSARMPAQGSTSYVISADLYKRLGGVVMYARYYDASNQQITTQGQNYFNTPADTWQNITLPVTTPADAAYIAIEIYVGTVEVDVNVDNVDLVMIEESGPYESLQNPSFELPAGSDRVIPHWELTHGAWDNMTLDSTKATQGSNSLRIHNPTGQLRYGVRSSHLIIEPNVSYRLKADVNRTLGALTSYLRFYDANGTLIDSVGTDYRGGLLGDWETMYLAGRTPANATTLAVELYVGAAQSDVNIDNIQIELDPRADIVTETFPVPMTTLETHAGDIAKMPDGTYRTWIVAGGNEEAFLYEIDTLTREVLNEWKLPGVARSYYARIDNEGTVWAGAFTSGNGARLFMLPFGAEEPIDVGRFSDDGRIFYQFDFDDEGAVYLGSYEGLAAGELPPARVGKYDPATDTWEDFGILDPALTYINTVSVVGDYAYVGAGTEWAGFYKVHTQTGSKEALTIPTQVEDCARVYESDVVGDLIFVRFSNCEGVPSKGWIYDTTQEEWSAEIPGFQGQYVSDANADGIVYMIAENHLSTFNLETNEITKLYKIDNNSGTRGIVEIDDSGIIVGFTGDGNQWTYDLATGQSTFDQVVGLLQSKIPPHAMAEGPDGVVYVTGYFQGGIAGYDPRDDSYEFWPFPPQAERVIAHQGKLYLGTYTGAELWEFDPAQDWELYENPRRVVDLRGISQDRPFGIASAGDYVAMGTVPDYGKLGGTLAFYDPVTGEVDTYENLIADHSIVALTYDDGILYGATSVWGGLGSTPTDLNAQVFAFDIETRQILWTTEPFEGERALTDLTVDEYGDLWVVSPGMVLKLDNQGNFLGDTQIVAYDWAAGGAVWFGGAIEYDAVEKRIYGTTSRALFSLDVETMENNTFGVRGEYFVLHTDGTRYYTIGYDLIKERSTSRHYPDLGLVGAVVFDDQPGTEADQVIIPASEGTQYTINGEILGAGSYPASGRVVVLATALDGYVLPQGARTSWEFEFSSATEPTEVAASGVNFIDNLGTENDHFIIPQDEGVTYLLGDQPLAAGVHPGTGHVEITAIADEGYVLSDGSANTWTHTFSTEDDSTPPGDGGDDGTGDGDGTDDDDGTGDGDGDGTDDPSGPGGEDNGPGTGADDNQLPVTGANQTPVALIAFALLSAGAVAWIASRRRQLM